MSEDTEMAEQATRIELAVLAYVRSNQGLHGMKHSDHARYRKHCTSRLAKLRTQLQFKQGRQKYHGKPLPSEGIADARWLELLLLEAERAWAMAQEIKADLEQDKIQSAGKRRHMLRRAAKARKYAHTLAGVSARSADARTAAEAQIYADVATGKELFEKDSDAAQCAAHYQRAQDASRSLATCGRPESRAAARVFSEDAESMLRLALHRTSRQQNCSVAAVQLPELAANDHVGRAVAEAGSAEHADGAQAGGASGAKPSSAFAWRGVQLTLQSQTVAKHAAEAHAKLQQSLDSAPAADARHADAAAAWTNCGKRFEGAAKAMQAAAGAADEATEDAGCMPLLGAAVAELQMAQYEAQGLAVNSKALLSQQQDFMRSKSSERGARPEDCARLFDGLYRAALALETAASALAMPPAAAQSLVAASAASAELFAAGRALHVALLRRGRADHTAAIALCDMAHARLVEAWDAARALAAEAESDVLAGWSEGGLHSSLCRQLEGMVAGFRVLCQSEAASAAETRQTQVAEGVQNLSLQRDAWASGPVRPAKRKAATQQPQAPGQQCSSCASLVDPAKGKSELLSLPDLLQPLPMRPILLDTAAQFIEEPDISHRCSSAVQDQRQAQGTSMVQSLKGLFGFR